MLSYIFIHFCVYNEWRIIKEIYMSVQNIELDFLSYMDHMWYDLIFENHVWSDLILYELASSILQSLWAWFVAWSLCTISVCMQIWAWFTDGLLHPLKLLGRLRTESLAWNSWNLFLERPFVKICTTWSLVETNRTSRSFWRARTLT